MTHADLLQAHRIIDKEAPESLIESCNYVLRCNGSKEQVKLVSEASRGLYGLFQSLLLNGKKTEAAILQWGNTLFDPRPRSVRLIWEDLERCSKLLIIGHGSAGKSYTLMAWTLLDWVEDPWYTSTKLISTTEGHAKANTFSTLTMLHKEAALPMPGVAKDGFIGMETTDKRASISVVAIPAGDTGKGRLQGFHPIPRKRPHPKFGNKTRVRAIMDEAEHVPEGVWEGTDNMLITQDDSGSVKVAGATNPRDRGSQFGQRVAPIGGWQTVDIETSERWEGQEGWEVLRLDGKLCENVIAKKEIFSGLITYDGYMTYVKKGTHHPEYYTMARGWYPEQSSEFTVISPQFFNNSRGIFTFEGGTINVGSLDPAFADGGDDPVLSTGVMGQAIAFTPAHLDQSKEPPQTIEFDSPFTAVQIEQQIVIQKNLDPTIMGNDIMDMCRGLDIRPEYFVMDMTGNGLLLYGFLANHFGSILGVEWGGKATEQKILKEDPKNPYERFIGIRTEMYFAFGDWMRFGFLKFAPILSTYNQLFKELPDRRYRFRRGLQELEDKTNFKARNQGKSPDHADSAVMLLHLVRMRESQMAQLTSEDPRFSPTPLVTDWRNLQTNPVDTVEFIDVS